MSALQIYDYLGIELCDGADWALSILSFLLSLLLLAGAVQTRSYLDSSNKRQRRSELTLLKLDAQEPVSQLIPRHIR